MGGGQGSNPGGIKCSANPDLSVHDVQKVGPKSSE